MTTATPPSRKSRTGVIIGVVAVLLFLVAGFAPVFPSVGLAVITTSRVGSTTQFYTSYSPTTVYGTTVQSSTVYFTNTQQSISTAQLAPFSGSSFTLKPQTYEYWSAQIPAEADVQVTFSAANTLNAYLFNSQQFAAYSLSSGSTSSPNEGTVSNLASGTIAYVTPIADTYYFVLDNPCRGLLCISNTDVGVFSVSSTASYQVVSTVTVTLSSVTSSVVTTTSQSSVPIVSSTVSSSTVTTFVTSTTTTDKGLLGP